MIPYEPGDWVILLEPFPGTIRDNPGFYPRMCSLSGEITQVVYSYLTLGDFTWYEVESNDYVWSEEWVFSMKNLEEQPESHLVNALILLAKTLERKPELLTTLEEFLTCAH